MDWREEDALKYHNTTLKKGDENSLLLTPIQHYQSFLTKLGKYLLGIQLDHSTGTPRAILQVALPNNWLIIEDERFVVDGEYFTQEDVLYLIGPGPEQPALILDDSVDYVLSIIGYNDAIEAKKLQLEELIRQKEVLLTESIQSYRQKLEADGVKFKDVTINKPQYPVSDYEPEPQAKDEPDWDAQYVTPARPTRQPLPDNIDPSIFDHGDEDPRERQMMPPYRLRDTEFPDTEVIEAEVQLPKTNGGLQIVKDMPRYNRDEVIRQRHDDSY